MFCSLLLVRMAGERLQDCCIPSKEERKPVVLGGLKINETKTKRFWYQIATHKDVGLFEESGQWCSIWLHKGQGLLAKETQAKAGGMKQPAWSGTSRRQASTGREARRSKGTGQEGCALRFASQEQVQCSTWAAGGSSCTQRPDSQAGWKQS